MRSFHFCLSLLPWSFGCSFAFLQHLLLSFLSMYFLVFLFSFSLQHSCTVLSLVAFLHSFNMTKPNLVFRQSLNFYTSKSCYKFLMADILHTTITKESMIEGGTKTALQTTFQNLQLQAMMVCRLLLIIC